MTQTITEGSSLSLGIYTQLITHIDWERHALWHYLNAKPRPTFTQTLLGEIKDIHERLKAHLGSGGHAGSAIRYLVLASSTPSVFSLGGDLELFARLIRARDHAGLTAYGRLCIDCVYRNAVNDGNRDLTTIALVQGSALGGGFEAALSTNVLIAEKGATFGFPEILFNLFAGMGAYNLLARRLDMARAERMLRSGRQYSAKELYEMGVVDVLAEAGEGVQAVNEYIRKRRRTQNGMRAIQRVRQRLFPLSYGELEDVLAIWVDAAMCVTDRDLRTMERLVAAQHALARRNDDVDSDRQARVANVMPMMGVR